jgi:D-glycero-D-manno-heptose 1,7-bisphosphate phosphatase
MERLRPAVFLDRDGTIIADRHYLSDPAGVQLLPRAGEAVRWFGQLGFVVVVVTNQSGIGRGYFGEAEFQAVQQRMLALLDQAGAAVDGVYCCPHAPGRVPPCDCRKPAIGLFRRAAHELGLDCARSYYIGDRERDVEPALSLGGMGIRLDARARARTLPAGRHLVLTDLYEAAAFVADSIGNA